MSELYETIVFNPKNVSQFNKFLTIHISKTINPKEVKKSHYKSYHTSL